MATGGYDGQDVWIYGEDDPASPFSDTLNLLAESTSTGLATDRASIASLEANLAEARWFPVYRAYKGENSDVPNDDPQGPGSMTVDFASGSWPSPVHSSIREVPASGYYRITAAARFQGTVNTGPVQLTIRKNATDPQNPATGATIGAAYGSSRGDDEDTTLLATCSAQFTAGESFTMGVRQATGAALQLIGGPGVVYSTYIEAEFLRPA